jgi:hypothetical protein
MNYLRLSWSVSIVTDLFLHISAGYRYDEGVNLQNWEPVNSELCVLFCLMLTWLEVERWRSRGVSNRVNMESRRKAQIFPMWASGISSDVLRVTECSMLMYMVSTQVLKYYRRLLRIVNQMALSPLFSVSSIANFFWQLLLGYSELVKTVMYLLVHCCHVH